MIVDVFELWVIFSGSLHISEIIKGMFGEGITPLIVLVVIGAAGQIVLIVELAWKCFEGGKEVLDGLYVVFGGGWIYLSLFWFLVVGPVHRAQ